MTEEFSPKSLIIYLCIKEDDRKQDKKDKVFVVLNDKDRKKFACIGLKQI